MLPSAHLGLQHVCPVRGGVSTLTPQLEGAWGQGSKVLGWRGRMELEVGFAGRWAGACGQICLGSADDPAEPVWPQAVGLRVGESRARARGLELAWQLPSTSTFSSGAVSQCPEVDSGPAVLSAPLGVFAAAPHQCVPVLWTLGAGMRSLPDLNGL